jgi:BON domain
VKRSCPILEFRRLFGSPRYGLFARVGLVGLLLTPPLIGQSLTWRAPVDSNAQSTTNDLQLTVRVRRALNQDDELAPHQIGVSVKGQVITLYGSVSSGDLSQRAADRARRVLGVVDVRNEILIAPAEVDPLLAFRRPAFVRSPQPPNVQPVGPDGAWVKEETARFFPYRPGAQASPSPTPYRANEEQEKLSRSGGNLLPREGNVATGGVFTLPAIHIGQSASSLPDKPKAVLSSAPRQEPDSVFREIEAVHQSNPDYATVRYRLVDGTIYLANDPGYAAVRFEFAQAIANLPGVQRIVMEEQRK